MSAKRQADGSTTPRDEEIEERRKSNGSRHPRGYVISQIDPETLPDDPRAAWDEARRRWEAYKAGRDGWRTGKIESQISDFDGGDDGRA